MNRAPWKAKYHFGQHPTKQREHWTKHEKKMHFAWPVSTEKGKYYHQSAPLFFFFTFFFGAWSLPLFGAGLVAMRMNSAIPDRPLLLSHPGLPAESCLVVQWGGTGSSWSSSHHDCSSKINTLLIWWQVMSLNGEVEKLLPYLHTHPHIQHYRLAMLLAEKAAILNFCALISP